MHFVDQRAGDIVGVRTEPFSDWLDRFNACLAPEDRERWFDSIMEGIYDLKPWDAEARFIRPDGREMYVRGLSHRRRVGDEIVSNGLMLDVTDRKRAELALKEAHDKLEARVRERTAELREAYQRLEAETAERRQMEEHLRQAQKMEAIGTLAGGIAHDFNNMLAVILGNAELASDELKGDDDGPRHNIEQIMKASRRARDLVKQILAFSRKSERGRTPVDIGRLVRETMTLLRGSLPSTIRIELEAASEAANVLGDEPQVQQVLMNLATNAAHAMRERGGTLTISIGRAVLTDETPRPDSEIDAGQYVTLSVADTGTGMDSDTLKRAFEPFFTTKEVGQGTGMGLSVVYGIVKAHGGTVTAESTPGVGSRFTVYLPAATEVPAAEGEKEARAPGGRERVLLVDDEPLVVEAASVALSRLGYEVTSATGGAEALAVFSAAPERFDVVITDQTMPDVTGMELAGRLLDMRADLPIILFTGYSELVSKEKARAAGVREFLMKPVVTKELAETIRRVLEK
jgi:signal transduction histidine kinase/ActR/RegA family two-component response regulator